MCTQREGNPNYENAKAASPLSEPFQIFVDGRAATPASGGYVTVWEVSKMDAKWTAHAATPTALLTINASIDATGYCDFAVTVTPTGGGAPAGGSNMSIELRMNADPTNSLMMMGLGAPGGYIDELPPPPAPAGPTSEWLVLDFGHDVAADAFALFSSADGVHDPKSMSLQVRWE